MDKIYDIYAIINLVNNKIYVGQTKRGYRKRFLEHIKPNDGSPYLKNAIKKYGVDNFECELLDIAYDQETANEKEKSWISALKTFNGKNGYNILMGGNVKPLNSDTKNKMSSSKKGELNSFYGKKHSTQSKEKMSKWKRENYILEKHPLSKKVKCIELNRVFNCVREAEIELNINAHHIGQVANNKYGRKTAGGYRWKWVK